MTVISRADAIACLSHGEGCGHSCRNRINALPSAELPKGDLISRRWLLDLYGDYIGDNGDTKYHVPLEVVRQNIIDAPSAEAKPTVIRSTTLMPTNDFKEWAKRVRETNPNAVVIPCDAEVVSSNAVQGEWEFVDNEIFAGEYFCSICGKRAEVDLYGEWILSNFCPSCGARMCREDGET